MTDSMRAGRFRNYRLVLDIWATFTWAVLCLHYGIIVHTYARTGFWLRQPYIYIAAESWLLACLVLLMIFSLRLLGDIAKE